MQEIKKLLKGLDGLKIIGADIVEVAPAYDTQGTIPN
jgi:agmatinase